MSYSRIGLAAVAVILTIGLAILLSLQPAGRAPPGDETSGEPGADGSIVRIGLWTEGDVFAEHRHFRALAEHLAARLDRPVKLMTPTCVDGMLDDLRHARLHAAFLGPLMSARAIETLDAPMLLRPEIHEGPAGYRGVIFVPADSPIRTVDDLAGRGLVLRRDTLAGELYAPSSLHRRELLGPGGLAEVRWVDRSEMVFDAVLTGLTHAGATSDRQLTLFRAKNPGPVLRVLETGPRVPHLTLVVSGAPPVGPEICRVLLAMNADTEGRTTLRALGASRFIRCGADEHEPTLALLRSEKTIRAALETSESMAAQAGENTPPGER